MIEAELADGRILEFPDGTDPNVIQSTVKKVLGQTEKPAPTLGDRVKALQGGLYRGAAGLAGLPMDTVENVYNLAKAGVGSVAAAAGRPDLAPNLTRGTPLGSEWIANQLQNFGINTQNPRPDDPASRMLHTGGVIGGGSMLPGAAVKPALTAAAGGAVAGEISDKPLAPAIGAMVPGAVGQIGAAAKNAVAARAAPTVETFKQAGTVPSVGQAADNVFLHGLENLASKFPGGAGVMQKFIEGQQRSMGAQARTGVPTEAAGRAIEKGVMGEGGFLQRTREIWKSLDDALGKKVGTQYKLPPNNTMRVLDELIEPVPGAERTTNALVNSKIREIRNNFRADTIENLGGMPFEAMRDLRSRVGSMIDDALVSGVPSGEMKKIYAAMSQDMEAAAKAVGAGREFARQNNYYRARMDRVESVLERVIGKGKQPEDIFKSFYPTDPDQAGKVRAVLRSLAPSERKVVTEAVANRLGRAKPGAQDVEGEVFSSETFLTNWNKLSPGAKAQLFPDPPMRENMNKIAAAASEIRTGKGIYANPSGTAGSFAAYSVYLSPLAAIAAGSTAPLVAAGSAAGSAYLGAKLLTNPKVVDWLAKPINPQRPGEAAAHLARLAVIYNQSDESTKQELGAFIQSIGKQ